MINCPECGRSMKKQKRELSPGIYAQVEVCSKCTDEWLDENDYETIRAMFRRKAFKLGGSLAVRIPKEIADALGIGDGDELAIKAEGDHLVIEKV